MSSHGKKIGKLNVQLDRVIEKVRFGFGDRRAEFQVDLRFDFDRGVFWAAHEGKWFSAATKAALEKMIKSAVERTIDLVWERYLVVDYEASAHPIEISGAPNQSTGNIYGIDSDRADLRPDPDRRYHKLGSVIVGMELTWRVVDYTQPWRRPESGKIVRSKRDVDFYEEDDGTIKEVVGDPREEDDAALPTGAVLWTKEREDALHGILRVISELDRRVVDLFRGDSIDLARKLDALQPDPSRLLTAPPAELAAPTPKRRKRA